MNASTPASLDSKALALRLHDLVGEERNVQVDFILHLDEFDQRRAYLEGGYGSLWDYCLKALHLREGAAWRRMAAMRVLRRFPSMEAALRDGRLCLSTLALLGQVLTDENAGELLARAAWRSKAEVDSLVASVKPRPTPADGVRKLPEPARAHRGPAAAPAAAPPAETAVPLLLTGTAAASARDAGEPRALPGSGSVPPVPTVAGRPPLRDAPVAEMHAVSEDRWSLRVTIDRDLKEDLETLAALLSHKVPRGNLAAVLREAIRCGIEKHGKRKGAVAPARKRSPRPAARDSKDPRAIPVEVRRQVWKRDAGRCSWTGPDGKRCDSRWQLELDHIVPPLFGGRSNIANLRLRCRAHNLLYAEQVYGRGHMDRFRREQRLAPNG
jgi:hypothetical protein